MSPSMQRGAASTSRAAISPSSQAGSATSSSSKKGRSLPWGTSYGDEDEGAGSGSGYGIFAKVKKRSSLSPLVTARDQKVSSGGRPTSITNTPSSSSPTASRRPPPPPRPASPPLGAQPSSTFQSRLPPPPRNAASSSSAQAPSVHVAHPPTAVPSRASPLLPRPRLAPQRAAPVGTGAAPPGMKKRGPAPDSLLFGDDPPIKRRASETPEVKYEVKPEPRPALTQADTVLFSKATPVLQAPLFPKAVHSRSTGVIKRSAGAVDFKPLEDINREKQEFARRFPLVVPKKEREEGVTSKSGAGDAQGNRPVASTSAAKHTPLSPKQRKAVASGSSALTSSPPIHPRMDYSREDLDKRFGRPTFVSDGSDSSDEAVVVSSRSSSAPNRSRAASPSRGGGAGSKGLSKGKGNDKGKERAEHKVGKEKKAAKKSATASTARPRAISPELGHVAQQTDTLGRKKARTKRKPEEWYWRNLNCEAGVPPLQLLLSMSQTLNPKRNLVDQPTTDERLLKVSMTHVITNGMEVVLNEHGGWNVDLLVDLVDPDNPGNPLSSHDEQLRLIPSSLPALPEGYAATSPDGANSASMILPFLLDSTSRPLQLIIKVRVGQYTYSATTDISTATSYTFDGTLPFSTSPDPTAGIRVSIALLSPRHRPSTTDAVLDGLTHRFQRIELETGAKGEVWIPDPVKVEIPTKGGKEKEPVRMPDLGLRKGGYDFVTKEPIEAGDIVKLYEGETVESLSSIIAGFDRRIATSSLDFCERVIARAHQRFCSLNPLPPTVALRELACWRYYAPLVHHFHLRPKLAIHLIDRFKRRLISAAEMRDVLIVYDEEVKRIEDGERVGYEEWKRRVLAEKGGRGA